MKGDKTVKKTSKPVKQCTSTVDAKVVKNAASEKTTGKEKKNEIDELFASKPKVTPAVSSSEKAKKTKKDAPPVAQGEDDWTDSKGERKKKRTTTEEGYPIYSVQEMKIGLGGDTPDCPFDCQCCF